MFLTRLSENKITKCPRGELKQFGYHTILVSFFLDQVPLLIPQVAFHELRARDTCMHWWFEVMAFHGGGGPRVKYASSFSLSLDDHLLTIEDYAYAGIDFQGDPDLSLPEDE